jgi:two-component system sensor histidine kinase MtrB
VRPEGPERGISLRLRITIVFVGAALAVSAGVAGITYVLADRYLLRQRVEDATQQTFSNVRFALTYLSRTPEEEEEAATLPELVDVLGARGGSEAMVIPSEGASVRSAFSITEESIPPGLGAAAVGDRVAYAFADTEPRQLVFGSPVPGHDLTAYFFFPLGDLEETLLILSRVLFGVSIGAVLVAALVGSRVSARVVDPVRRASRAARRVAEGLLETRLDVQGGDELAALAASFNEMAAALEERIARERRFVGDVSHELRTPLATLRASTDYLLEHTESLAPPVQRAAHLLEADLQYLQRLVDDLLDLTRVQSGRVQMSWEQLNLADLAREVVARRTRTGDQQVRIELDADREMLQVVADKRRLERVVGNLLENALTHGEGKEVTVRLGADDGALLVSVEDQGPGIPPGDSGRIFERFFKADPARHRRGDRGAGLGLAIARENAHLHGGEIHASTGQAGGARFELRLPRRDDKA